MKLDKDNTTTINGYIIKNLVCQTSTFRLCDAIDSNGNSFVLKIIPADIKVNLLKEEHVIESFVHNDKLFIVYAENNFAKEGNDYFSYYMSNNNNNNNTTCNSIEDKNVKSILNNNTITTNNNNNNNSINAGVNKFTNIKFCSSSNNNNNNNNNTNVNNIDKLSIDLKNGNYLEKKIGFNNKKIIRTPIPKNCNINFNFPGTPESNVSFSEDSESDSESDSECDSNESFDDEDEDDHMSDEDSDIEHEIITPINKNLDENNNNSQNLIPILKIRDSNLKEDHIKRITPKTSPNYVHQPSHIHIQCPLMKLMHPKHTEIRKTPIPREMLKLNQNHSINLFSNSSLENEIASGLFSSDSSSNNDNYNITTANKQSGEPFKLEMVKSSMLRRRSSTKCQSST